MRDVLVFERVEFVVVVFAVAVAVAGAVLVAPLVPVAVHVDAVAEHSPSLDCISFSF